MLNSPSSSKLAQSLKYSVTQPSYYSISTPITSRTLFRSRSYCTPSSTQIAPTVGVKAADLSNKVFIGNLPFTVTEDEIKKLVLNLKLKGMTNVSVPRGKKSKKGMGYVFVDFDSVETATSASKVLDGAAFEDRTLNSNVKDKASVEATKEKKEEPTKKQRVMENSVYLANLEITLTEEEIITMCNDMLIGDNPNSPKNLVVSIEKPISKATGEARGFCYVEFVNPEIVQLAVKEFNNLEVLDKLLYCEPMKRMVKKIGFAELSEDELFAELD